jgi:hypothetical protein
VVRRPPLARYLQKQSPDLCSVAGIYRANKTVQGAMKQGNRTFVSTLAQPKAFFAFFSKRDKWVPTGKGVS